MSYRCEVCGGAVPPKRTRRLHVISRTVPIYPTVPAGPRRTEIARELPVCGACQALLDGGTPLPVVRNRQRAARLWAAAREQAEAAKRPKQVPAQTPPPVPVPAPLEVAQIVTALPTARRVSFGKAKGGGK